MEEKVLNFYRKMTYGESFQKIIDAKNISDIIYACIERSYVSAFRQTAKNIYRDSSTIKPSEWKKYLKCNIKTTNIKDKNKKIYKEIFDAFLKDRITSKICKFILNLNPNNEIELKKLYRGVAEDTEISLFKNGFSFGIFQKIFNMSIKYLYCFMKDTEINPEIDRKTLNLNFSKAHCPIDSNILIKLNYTNGIYNNTPWSKLNYKAYNEIQMEIPTKYKSKLDFDFENWD